MVDVKTIDIKLPGFVMFCVNTNDATATAEDIVTGKTAYVNGVKVVGTHECDGE